MRRWGWVLAALFTATVHVGASAQCEGFLAQTLATLAAECGEQGVGVCYGNGPLVLEPSVDAGAVVFSRPGHEAPLTAVDTAVLSPFEGGVRGWGLLRFVVPLNTTADRLTLVAIGDMALQNTGDPADSVPSVMARVTTDQGLNIRAGASAAADLLAPAFTGDVLRLTGVAGDWVRVQLPDGTTGWAAASGFAARDVRDLTPVDPDAGQPYGPMQAFNFATDPWTWNADGCPVAPPNGILVQTPAAATEAAALRVNGTDLRLPPGLTAFLSTNADGDLRADTLEGTLVLVIDNTPLTLAAGQTVLVREGTTPAPTDYDPNRVGVLPLETLPRPAFAAVNFALLVAPDDGTAPELGADAPCTVGAVVEAANLREFPAPDARVRHVLQVGERVPILARAEGRDGVLWWQVVAGVWVSSRAVSASGMCGTLPVIDVR